MDTGTVVLVVVGLAVLVGGFYLISQSSTAPNATTVALAQIQAAQAAQVAAINASTNPNTSSGLSIAGLGSVSNSTISDIFGGLS
jgi:hypothetical protein